MKYFTGVSKATDMSSAKADLQLVDYINDVAKDSKVIETVKPANPVPGSMYTDFNKLYVFNGTIWISFSKD